MSHHVDHAEIKLGQLLTIVLAALAMITQSHWPLLLLGITFLLSGTLRAFSPFALIYRGFFQPLNIIQSDYRLDNIQPHKFGQLIGALTVAIALGLLQAGYGLAGWSVVALLILLTVVSYAGWCIGCFLYYQLNRLGLGGFFRHAPTDKRVFPGMRPGKRPTRAPNRHPPG